MSDFKVKMFRIRLLLGYFCWGFTQTLYGSTPDSAGWAYSAPPNPYLYLWGLLLSEGRRGEGEKKVKGRKGKGEGGETRWGRDLAHPKILAWRPLGQTPSLC